METVLATTVYCVCLCDWVLKITLKKPSKQAYVAKEVIGRTAKNEMEAGSGGGTQNRNHFNICSKRFPNSLTLESFSGALPGSEHPARLVFLRCTLGNVALAQSRPLQMSKQWQSWGWDMGTEVHIKSRPLSWTQTHAYWLLNLRWQRCLLRWTLPPWKPPGRAAEWGVFGGIELPGRQVGCQEQTLLGECCFCTVLKTILWTLSVSSGAFRLLISSAVYWD